MANDIIEYTKSKWGTEDPSKVATEISQGHQLATQAFGLSTNIKYRSQVVQAGAVDHILNFLSKTNQPFDDVVNKDSGENSNKTIECPSIWLNILNNFCRDGFVEPKSLAQQVQYKILTKLGPLFQDMDNFEKRQLFGSTDYWIKSLMFFCNMLYSLLSSDYKRIGDFLMKQSKLKGFLVRVVFLEISEPDLCKQIIEFSNTRDTRIPKPDIIGLSQTFCISSIKHVMTKRDDSKTITEEFGVTKIRPEHDLDFVAAIIRLLQTNQRDGWYESGGFASALQVFMILFDRLKRFCKPFRVDSCAACLVKISTTYISKYAPLSRDRYFYENVVTSIVTIGATMMTPMMNTKQGPKQVPIDHDVAKAVEAGLYEYFIDVCDTSDARLAKPLEGLIRTVVSTLTLEETRKAMIAKGPVIQARLERIKGRHPVLLQELVAVEHILKNPIIKSSSTQPTTMACEFCQEKTAPEKIIKCPFCRTVCYCSDDCQKLNWMLHQTTCEDIRKEPKSKSPDELNKQGKLLFGKYVTNLLLQAALKGISILDCIVVIDMCEITPLLKTYKPEEFAKMYIQDEEAIKVTKKILDRNKANGSITASFTGFTPDGLNASLVTLPPSTAPLLPMVVKTKEDKQKWLVAQRVVAQSSLGGGGGGQGALQKMQSNPRIYQMTLLKTMKP